MTEQPPSVQNPGIQDTQSLIKRSWELHTAGEDFSAEASLKQAIALDSQAYDAYYLMGLIYRKRGDTQTAQANFEQALALVKAGAIKDDANRHNMTLRMITSHLDFLKQ